MLVGGGTLKDLDPDTNTIVTSFLGCKEVIKSLTSKDAANNIEWKSKIKANEYLQANPDNIVCNDVKHENREACNQYVNNCKKHHLLHPDQVTTYDTLDEALYEAVNRNNISNARMCISLGANCNFHKGLYTTLSLIYFGVRDAEFEQLLLENGAEPMTRIESDTFDTMYSNYYVGMFNMPDTVTFIGSSAFKNNDISTLRISESLTDLPFGVFQENKIVNVNIPRAMRTIGDSVFRLNKIKTLTFSPDSSLISIATSAFGENEINSLILPSSLETIGDYSFSYNRIVNLVIPDSVKYIGVSAFSNNQLRTVKIPHSVETIGRDAFAKNNIINTMEIPRKFENEISSICGHMSMQGSNVTKIIYI
jgi:hypothetical protein